MSGVRFFNIHRSWEDWFGMLFGLLIVISPLLAGPSEHGSGVLPDHAPAIFSAVITGLLVFCVAEMEYMALQRWEEMCEMVLGLWLIMSPLVLGYSGEGSLRFWHTSLGGVVVLMAALKLWQDWNLTDRELARHGQ
ncbi:MAG: SPW repeat protein [Xanthobacteraceae bacterium]|nr:SPW repeat protein [Xanthobacteraceae bacterium]